MVKLDINFIFVNPKNITIKGGYLMKPNYTITVEKRSNNIEVLCIRYYLSKRNLLFGVNFILKNALKESFITKDDIRAIKVLRTDDKVKIKVEYYKNEITPKAKIKYQKRAIKAILKKLGYSKEEIKNISYKDEMWNVEICGYFELDEYESIYELESFIENSIKKELNIDVDVCIS